MNRTIRFHAPAACCLAILLVLGAALTLGSSPPRATAAGERQPSSEPGTGRAFSLAAGEQEARKCLPAGSCPAELRELGGLTQLVGYVTDPAQRDMILVGTVDETRPPLRLEDFVVALRNAWWLYSETKGHTVYYSPPGCSIDPKPEGLADLQRAGNQVLGASDPSGVTSGIEFWRAVCRQPQRVRVLGIPFDTEFAQLMVTADYDMKRLVDGSVSLEIAGLRSLTDMTLQKVEADLRQGRSVSIPARSMSRFWFFPGETRYVEDEGVLLLQEARVQLLTEEQYLGARGQLSGKGAPDPIAQAFVQAVSERYAPIARKRPIYAELEGLFRHVGLAKMMKAKDAPAEAKFSVEYFLKQYPMVPVAVERALPGIPGVKELEVRQAIPGGYSVAQVWLPSCGGVSIDIPARKNDIARDRTGSLRTLRRDILASRPSPHALSWNFTTNALWR